MPKRQGLDYNLNQLAANIKESTGKGVDALFSPQSPAPSETTRTSGRETKPETIDKSGVPETNGHPEKTTPSDDSMLARKHASKHASSHASTKDKGKEQESSYQQDAIRKARKLVNLFGHQTVYLRVTEEEKLELKDLAHKCGKNMKTKIGETLLGRIALTMMIEDHKKNNKNSFLNQVLKQTEE